MGKGSVKKLFAVVVVIILIATVLLLTQSKAKDEENPPFKLSYNSERVECSDSLIVHIDVSKEWQFSAAVCFVSFTSDGDKGGSDYYLPLFFSTGQEIPKAVEKYPNIKTIELSSFGNDESEASMNIAKQYWRKIELAVVVTSYENALLASALASYLNAPIIYHGKGVENFLKENGIESIIIIGDAEYKGIGQLRLSSQEEIWEFYLSILQDTCNYIVVTNPYDIGDEKLFIPYLSLASAQLSAEHNAIVITANFSVEQEWNFKLGYGTDDAGSGERGGEPDMLTDEEELDIQMSINEKAIAVDNAIDNAVEFLRAKGVEPLYLALVGGPASIPMLYIKSPVWYEGVNQEEKGEEYLATDSYYGDLDLKLENTTEVVDSNYYELDDALYTQELAVGRIVAQDLLDASALVTRSLGYWKYEYEEESTFDLDSYWGRRAEIVNSLMCGDSDTFSGIHQQEVFAENQMYADMEAPAESVKFFLPYIIFDEATAVKKMEDMNAIIYDGHGYPDGWYWLWASTHDNEKDFDRIGSEDVCGLRLHPAPVFGACCLSSALDWPVVWNTSANRQEMTPDKIIALAFIHAGAICYVGATEESWGAFFGGLADGNNDEWGYGDFDMPTMMWEYLLGEDMTIGLALTNAKHKFYAVEWTDENSRPFARLCFLETVLYGDPCALPYHPGLSPE